MSCIGQVRPSDAVIDMITAEFDVALDGSLTRNGIPVGYVCSTGYVKVCVARRRYFAHRVVWLLAHGTWPCGAIDHLNGIRSDNRPWNLRLVTQAVNCQNKGGALVTNKSTGLLGANHHPSNGRRIRAQIWCGGKNHHIGYFNSPEEAHAAYLQAKAQLHPGFVPERFA